MSSISTLRPLLLWVFLCWTHDSVPFNRFHQVAYVELSIRWPGHSHSLYLHIVMMSTIHLFVLVNFVSEQSHAWIIAHCLTLMVFDDFAYLLQFLKHVSSWSFQVNRQCILAIHLVFLTCLLQEFKYWNHQTNKSKQERTKHPLHSLQILHFIFRIPLHPVVGFFPSLWHF